MTLSLRSYLTTDFPCSRDVVDVGCACCIATLPRLIRSLHDEALKGPKLTSLSYGRLVRCDIPAPRSAASRLYVYLPEDLPNAQD